MPIAASDEMNDFQGIAISEQSLEQARARNDQAIALDGDLPGV
jgi:hypothetical protein